MNSSRSEHPTAPVARRPRPATSSSLTLPTPFGTPQAGTRRQPRGSVETLTRAADLRRAPDGSPVPGAADGKPRCMSGPIPHGSPSDHPHEVTRDKTTQPETAPPGTAVSGFPEPPGKDP